VLLAFTGLGLAGCGILGGAGAVPSPTSTHPPEVDVLELEVGDCLATQGPHGATRTVPVVDCSEEHESEAYALISLVDGAFPGDDAVADRAVAECTAEFATFIGLDYATSSLDFAYYFPTRSSWDLGDRDIVCLAFDPKSEGITGSLAGAAR
jgi:hypothetical protein